MAMAMATATATATATAEGGRLERREFVHLSVVDELGLELGAAGVGHRHHRLERGVELVDLEVLLQQRHSW
eukprot:scaffold4162_cov53-Phaeocystis_antarctica.AAC.3